MPVISVIMSAFYVISGNCSGGSLRFFERDIEAGSRSACITIKFKRTKSRSSRGFWAYSPLLSSLLWFEETGIRQALLMKPQQGLQHC
jgi:hypothetical protein